MLNRNPNDRIRKRFQVSHLKIRKLHSEFKNDSSSYIKKKISSLSKQKNSLIFNLAIRSIIKDALGKTPYDKLMARRTNTQTNDTQTNEQFNPVKSERTLDLVDENECEPSDDRNNQMDEATESNFNIKTENMIPS